MHLMLRAEFLSRIFAWRTGLFSAVSKPCVLCQAHACDLRYPYPRYFAHAVAAASRMSVAKGDDGPRPFYMSLMKLLDHAAICTELVHLPLVTPRALHCNLLSAMQPCNLLSDLSGSTFERLEWLTMPPGNELSMLSWWVQSMREPRQSKNLKLCIS